MHRREPGRRQKQSLGCLPVGSRWPACLRTPMSPWPLRRVPATRIATVGREGRANAGANSRARRHERGETSGLSRSDQALLWLLGPLGDSPVRKLGVCVNRAQRPGPGNRGEPCMLCRSVKIASFFKTDLAQQPNAFALQRTPCKSRFSSRACNNPDTAAVHLPTSEAVSEPIAPQQRRRACANALLERPMRRSGPGRSAPATV
jgi:hypothetical protein